MPRAPRSLSLFFLCAVALATCCACSFQSGSNSGRVTPLQGGGTAAAGSGVYVAMPMAFQRETNSGKRIQTVLLKALEALPGKKAAAPAPFPLEHDLRAARDAGCAFLLQIRIVDWQDPPASFQYKPDRGEVALSLYDAANGELLRVDAVECSSTATTLNLIGSEDPGDCLKPSLERWRDAVFSPR